MAKLDATSELRDSFVEGVEIREGTDGQPLSLGGYAAVFNQEVIITSETGVRWREKIAPTAFREAIGRDDVIAAVNHDHKQMLGRSRAGTLTLKADTHGLRYDVTLPNTSVARDTIESVRRGDYQGSSFKFSVPKGGLRMVQRAGASPDDLPLLMIERVKLIDVGPVTFPAYEGTSVSLRSVPDVVTQFLLDAKAFGPVAVRARYRARIQLEAKAWAA